MTNDAKRLKIASLIALFSGIIAFILGLVIFVAASQNLSDLLAACIGIVCAWFGFDAARRANVPSRCEEAVKLYAGVEVVALLACIANIFFVKADTVALLVSCVCVLLIILINAFNWITYKHLLRNY